MADYVFIKATRDDLATLMKLRLATMDSHLKAAGLTLSEQQHEARVLEDGDCTFLIMQAGINLGAIKYKCNNDNVTILQLQIFPQFQNAGHGTAVLHCVFREAGNRPVALTVLKANPALHLYERSGFTIVGEDKYEYHMERKQD